MKLQPISADFRTLPVDEFMEKPTFKQPMEKWEMILHDLEQQDAVLVGNQEDLQAILTSTDVVNHLQRLAGAFIKLAEIETSLRRIIDACVDEDKLDVCVQNSLKGKYLPEEMPKTLSDMTLNDYVQIIGDGRNYTYFEAVFGPTDWQRKQTAARFKEVVDLRNVTFHFKRQLDDQDFAVLTDHRDWLEMKTRSFEGIRKKQLPIEPKKTEVRKKSRLNLDSLRAAVKPLQADFLSWMHDEAIRNHFTIRWDLTGFAVRTLFKGNKVSFIYGSNWGGITIYIHGALALTPAQTVHGVRN